jgi:hypothetical protein
VDDLIIHLMHNDPRFAQYSPAELNIPELQAFLAAHYTLQGNLGRYGVFRRNNNYLN